MARCYYDGEECDCNAWDTVGECPREGYLDDELFDEETIDEIYDARKLNDD